MIPQLPIVGFLLFTLKEVRMTSYISKDQATTLMMEFFEKIVDHDVADSQKFHNFFLSNGNSSYKIAMIFVGAVERLKLAYEVNNSLLLTAANLFDEESKFSVLPKEIVSRINSCSLCIASEKIKKLLEIADGPHFAEIRNHLQELNVSNSSYHVSQIDAICRQFNEHQPPIKNIEYTEDIFLDF
jgi:hypothetical protein